MTFKRSQLEDTLCRASAARAAGKSKILVRIKRLLDIDRKLPPKRGAGRDQRYAFYSEERPGAGHEAKFQEYEIIALDLALMLAAQGVPQTDVVEIFRAMRPVLQSEIKLILANPLEHYADITKAQEDGKPIMSNYPVFLAVTQAAGGKGSFMTKSGLTARLIRGSVSWTDLLWDRSATVATMLEFTLAAHAVHHHLNSIKPRKKGRP